METAITGSEPHGDLTDGLTNLFKACVNCASQCYLTSDATNGVNLDLMTRRLLRDQLRKLYSELLAVRKRNVDCPK